jgi:predicted S18 family serine protease
MTYFASAPGDLWAPASVMLSASTLFVTLTTAPPFRASSPTLVSVLGSVAAAALSLTAGSDPTVSVTVTVGCGFAVSSPLPEMAIPVPTMAAAMMAAPPMM